MADSHTRRSFVGLIGVTVTAALAGCFGQTHEAPPEEGEITFKEPVDTGPAWWAHGETMRVVVRTSGTELINRSYRLPASGENDGITVEPGTYDVQVSIDGKDMAEYTWDVTSCRNSLYIEIMPEETDGLTFFTSSC